MSIFGTEHFNLNTYYARPMADLFDTHSDGQYDFKAVASTLLKLTTLFDPNTNINYRAGPNLKPTHDVQYWTAKTRNFDFSGEDRVPTELYNKILSEGLKARPLPLPKPASRKSIPTATQKGNRPHRIANRSDHCVPR